MCSIGGLGEAAVPQGGSLGAKLEGTNDVLPAS